MAFVNGHYAGELLKRRSEEPISHSFEGLKAFKQMGVLAFCSVVSAK